MIVKASVRIHGGDYDCSEYVRTCAAVAGILPWGYWDSYMWTGNEVAMLTSHGFYEADLSDPKPGDVLWRPGHTEVYLGDWMQGGARHGDFPGGLSGIQGDQDGTEITRSSYNPFEWDMLLRYGGNANVNGIPATVVMVQVANRIIDDDRFGYSQYNREGDGTVETIEISWDDGKPDLKQGWLAEDGKWYLYKDGKKLKNHWEKWKGDWYFLGKDGAMVTSDWAKDNGKWYWLDEEGKMVANGWRKIDGSWYCFEHGAMLQDAPAKYKGGWCWFGHDGKCVETGALKIEDWYITD